jgi:PKD repeat protein
LKIGLSEDGFTGLEAAIILIAFVVIASAFSYTMLSAGFFTSQKSQEVVHTGLSQASSGLLVVGEVYGGDVPIYGEDYTTEWRLKPDFTASERRPIGDVQVQFYDATVTVDGRTPESWYWTFSCGDPAFSTEKNPIIRFQSAGETRACTVTLRVTLGEYTASVSKPNYIVCVDNPETQALVPVADFVGTPLRGEAPLTVHFTDRSVPAPDGRWTWDFGDGKTSSDQNPVHTYSSGGFYTVSLFYKNTKTGLMSTEKKMYYVDAGHATVPGYEDLGNVSTVYFTVGLSAGESPVDMGRAVATFSTNEYSKTAPLAGAIPLQRGNWTILKRIGGDDDDVLEGDELFSILVAPPEPLRPNERFHIEVKPPQGPVLQIARTVPPDTRGVKILY